jgi:serine/threonine-protein kinase
MHVTLTVTAGPHQDREFVFAYHDTFIVGRSKHAHFRLSGQDRYFSRIHFLVEVNPPPCRLVDLNSRNGTHVNGRRVRAVDLHDGDEIKAGRTMMRVAVHPGQAGGERAPVPPPAAPFSTAEPVPVIFPAHGTAPGTCRICAVPLPRAARASRDEGDALRLLVCPPCREQVRGHPQPVPGYHVVRELGRGSMGVVYLALREAGSTRVALKLITPAAAGSKTQVARLLHEAVGLLQLQHPHIAAFRDMGEVGDKLYFALDYVPGTDGGRLVREQGPLPVPRAVGLVCQVLQALEYAHARGFVHRDVKPSNVLVEEVAGKEVARLTDFGLARVYHGSALSGLTITGDSGSRAFMPPEQVVNFRDARPAADQYSAGATLYYLLTGRYVHDLPPEFEKQLLMIVQDPPVALQKRRPDLPRELALVVHRSLAKNPEKRFADVGGMRLALVPFAAE